MINYRALSLALCVSSTAFADSSYSVTVLPTPPAFQRSSAGTVSTFGAAGAASSLIDDTIYGAAILWQNGQYSLLSSPPGYLAGALAISNSGDIAGFVGPEGESSRSPALWHNRQLQILDTANVANGYAKAVNHSGDVVGPLYDSTQSIAALWHNGQLTILENFSSPTAINDNGQILLYGSDNRQPYIWSQGNTVAIPTLSAFAFYANSMNNSGDVTGWFMPTIHDYPTPFLFKDGVSTILPVLPNSTGTFASGMNNHGEIVGYSMDSDSGTHAVLWKDNLLFDLNDLIPPDSGMQLYSAESIADDGSIICFANVDSPILLTPVPGGFFDPASVPIPEPATLSLLALAALPIVRRRRL